MGNGRPKRPRVPYIPLTICYLLGGLGVLAAHLVLI
jgi:hypothetical protein